MAVYIRSNIVGLRSMRRRMQTRARVVPMTKTLHKQLDSSFRAAAAAFILEVVARIGVDTGMTASTLWPLAKAVDRVLAIQAVEGKEDTAYGGRRGVPTFPSGDRRAGIQGEAEGRKLGKQAYRFNTGDNIRPIFTFQFETAAFQHAFWDEFRWHSVDAGIQEFLFVLERRARRSGRLVVRAYLTGRKNAHLRLQGLEDNRIFS